MELSNVNASTSSLDHKKTADDAWALKHYFNIDAVLYKDALPSLQRIHQCINLREVHLTRPRCNDFKYFVRAIVAFSRKLEILDVPGITLDMHDLLILRDHTNLKILNIRIEWSELNQSILEAVYQSNTELVSVSTFNSYYVRTLPKTLKRYEIKQAGHVVPIGICTQFDQCPLEILSLPFLQLCRNDILILSKKTTFKSLTLTVEDHSDDILETLFLNNRGLEEFTLVHSYINGVCLKKLPWTLKRLEISEDSIVDDNETLIECIARCTTIESLSLFVIDSYIVPRIFQAVETVASTLQHLSLSGNLNNLSGNSFNKLIHLKIVRLKTFRVTSDIVTNIVRSCADLQELELSSECLELVPYTFVTIAAHRNISKLIINNGDPDSRGHLENAMSELARSQSLTNIKLVSPGINTHLGIALVRGCRNLTNLELSGENMYFPLLIQSIQAELMCQKHRVKPLQLIIRDTKAVKVKKMPIEYSYHLLELTMF